MAPLPAGYGPVMMQAPHPPPPPPPALGWKDYFIAAVVIGGVGYGAAMLAKRYVGPMFEWPKQSELEEDKRRFEEAFDRAKDALDDMVKKTQDTHEQMEQRAASVEQLVNETNDVLKKLGEREEEREKELNRVREELDRIHSALPKILEQSKESHSTVLSDLQSEIKSLKGLLANRVRVPSAVPAPITGGTAAAQDATPSTGDDMNTGAAALGYAPAVGTSGASALTSLMGGHATAGRPTIPAWQLASSASAKSSSPATSANGTPMIASPDMTSTNNTAGQPSTEKAA
ncbi:hypothetical protein SYNPS1DRAFT_24889 [Syncephalis pseudoplumigaleata]|uniref:Peroxisomal membrane protein PEX14 n=1 Tax=Syncephalis pseudoplumigaleata TaxID=1712513 RepID=A0A4P9YW18_9FUNG|nr:hypothetical protein SYNPS1DRAFT_24889 [Syncephalis pseudoplumigaleata]|eukprot:RKP23130.1 hypothetical protein SYNPS1DRAFT_24889 [Syncephalis pseudoplumigaleata]